MIATDDITIYPMKNSHEPRGIQGLEVFSSFRRPFTEEGYSSLSVLVADVNAKRH